MSFNLIDAAKSLMSNDLVNRASSLLGETHANTQQAMNGIIPAVFAGVLNKAGSGDAQGVMNLAKEAAGSGALGNLGGIMSGGASTLVSRGSDMLRSLFGDRSGNVVSAIANSSGIKESSATTLMGMATPAVLGVLGKHITDNNLSTGGLLSFLNNQKDHVLGALPSGLNLASALGMGSLASIGTRLSGALSSAGTGVREAAGRVTHMAETSAASAASGMRWLLPLLLIILVIGLIWYFVKGCNGSQKAETAVMDTAAARVDTAARAMVPPPVRESMNVKLPDGTEIQAYKGGIEDKLVAFLNDPNSAAGKDVWFDFDNLNFNTGSADITPESEKQVQAIVAILHAFPKVKIKVGGYTDRSGDSVANMKLSQDRANAVVADLKKDGAKASQLAGAEGYGSEFAKAEANAPDEERQKDRRISISVRSK
jgi:outer membrane protein OmpA-like peptidoglycan-associated protein